MKTFVLIIIYVFFGSFVICQSPFNGIVVEEDFLVITAQEEIQESTGVSEYFHCYRFSVCFDSENWAIQRIFGDSLNLWVLDIDGVFFQWQFGGLVSKAIYEPDLDNFPEAGFDSWFTLTGDNAYLYTSPEGASNTLVQFGGSEQPFDLFEDGHGFINGGDPDANYIIQPDHAISESRPTEEGKVLFMQLTTNSPTINCVFNFRFQRINNDGSEAIPIETRDVTVDFSLSSAGTTCQEPGCSDLSACNYNPFTSYDDGSCYFATVVYNCEGECQSDIDNDGVCDQLEGGSCNGADFCADGTLWDVSLQKCVPYDSCPSDLNNNGAVEIGDLTLFLVNFGSVCQ